MKTALLAILAVFVAASPVGAQSATDEIKAASSRFEQAFNRGDAAALAQMYMEQATLLPPDGDMITGRDAIETFWQGAIQSGLKNLSLTSVRVDALGGDAAREIGRLSVDVPGPQGRLEEFEGKYVVLWRKAGGEWLLDTDIWNADKPPQTAAGSAAPPTGAGAPR